MTVAIQEHRGLLLWYRYMIYVYIHKHLKKIEGHNCGIYIYDIYIYTNIHACIHINIYSYVYMHMCMYICIYIYIYIYIRLYAYMCAYTYKYTQIHVYRCI